MNPVDCSLQVFGRPESGRYLLAMVRLPAGAQVQLPALQLDLFTVRGSSSLREVAPAAERYGKQIRYADRRGIPYVWCAGDDPAGGEVCDTRSGEQRPADAGEWTPSAADLLPALTGEDGS